jgi:hypothetical protein
MGGIEHPEPGEDPSMLARFSVLIGFELCSQLLQAEHLHM